jgi:chemosensory pili system protein ChpC
MKSADEVYAVLMKLAGDTLLLPNAAIAEVVSAERLQEAAAGGPAWLAGTINYNELTLPVLRFEVMNGGTQAEDTRRLRVAILHGITERLHAGQYAVLCQGYPHLVTLNREALKKESRAATDREDLVLARVKIANTSALIPNLELMEAELADLESVSGEAA